jgi:hypothetical protein
MSHRLQVKPCRILLALCGLLALPLLPACSSHEFVDTWHFHADNPGMGETGDEHFHRVVRIEDTRRAGMTHDLDLLFMTDRPSRLTRWHEK